MLHRIVMVGLVVVGLVVAGLGVASATVWRPSDTAVMTTGEQSGATLLTTAPGVLSLVDRDVTITAESSDDATVVLALGSQVDVDGWIGEDPALRVTGASDWETLTVASAESAGAQTPAPTDGTEPTDAPESADAAEATTDAAEPTAPGPDPSGSDMWVESTSGTGSATLAWDASSTDQVLLVAAVGEDAAAPQLTLSWPREVTTPLLWPGVAVGVLLVVLGLIYGLVTRGRRRRSTQRSSVQAAPTTTTTPAAGTPATGPLTRRQLRELAEKEEAETAAAAAATAAAPRQKRQWPWTGAIPVVQASDAAKTSPDDDAPATPEAHRPAWLSEGTGSTSGSSWRAAWGVPTPAPGGDDADSPGSGAAPSGASGAAGAAGAGAAGAATPPATSGPSSAAAVAPAPRASAPTAPRPPAGQTSAPTGAAPAAQRPAPQSTTSSAPSPALPGRPAATPPVRPVDQSSPFQRITLRSSDQSAPARRIRREQQAPTAWSASRSPWAQPARPGTPTGPRPAPGTDDASPSGSDAPKTPNDDTTKDSD